jgi:hypothetical protein
MLHIALLCADAATFSMAPFGRLIDFYAEVDAEKYANCE